MTTSAYPTTKDEWQKALSELPEVKEGDGKKIPAFFFAHGSPILIWPKSKPPRPGPFGEMIKYQGPESPLSDFLKDFGKVILDKYKPKAIVVFSAHWEESGDMLVTDYGEDNPLLYDYYGFDPEFYEVTFSSKGDSDVAKRVVDLLQKAGIRSRLTTAKESRGRDGRGFNGPGLDHGVFVPFKVMWGDKAPLPIVQVSIDESLRPEKEWALGKAVDALRSEGLLILSGGLTIHTFQDFTAWTEHTAAPEVVAFSKAILDACSQPKESRKAAMEALTRHPGFRRSHPREEHFVPIYVAAGAGEDGEAKVLNGNHGTATVAFGL
ncbi:hypothetical protein M407DRAFT_240973 [Tulasnella calospora MUT 4182]|uniref:Extradiol ring-cleavage dioxygenase class III enzyme subunit B domain-containing protein n=1 Tax=Tulasnella calospora MUT 4182 TaxID=1051891 RepID=A0A0C3QLE8_9AGAM|nr:hypothetical protein M407DRAFT_240973 [Tulasnella calospora MUT 4182]